MIGDPLYNEELHKKLYAEADECKCEHCLDILTLLSHIRGQHDSIIDLKQRLRTLYKQIEKSRKAEKAEKSGFISNMMNRKITN